MHHFSSPEQPDKFKIQLQGDSILTATARVSIVTEANDTIWSDAFPATALLTDEEPQLTAAAQEAYIMQRIDHFFEAQNFLTEAIEDDARFDRELNGNYQIWQEIKQQHRPGFAYMTGDEQGHTLSYSAKLGKAVVVDSCC
ncbi:hypothetical protein BEN48_05750 [Hymenobacter glacialis]|uniref:Uncharacterized protein n=2 Tax=Hymenobacter glacialis TaxID=1908236 RepID=A0A1G1SSY6_9BACT|nr:hypothetical protein BEN48_05750 [Hymenobacter glacialis]